MVTMSATDMSTAERVEASSEAPGPAPAAPSRSAAFRTKLTPSQLATFDDLLAIGQPRPPAQIGLADDLRELIAAGTADTLEGWTGRSLWFGKSQLATVNRCEGALVAEAADRRPGALHPATVVGIASHRAIQLAHTHPGHPVSWYIDQSIEASLVEDAFKGFWETATPGVQSDLQMQMLSRVTAFLDSWPPLDDRWSWRFEESLQAKVGRLTLGAKVDLVLGRPRPDSKPTMFLADFKTGSVQEHHQTEAAFYALVTTLRYGIPPFRSTVYSLSAGEWTDPDVTAELLTATAHQVVDAVNAYVAVMTEQREPVLTPGGHCRFCPARDTCPVAELS